MRVESLAAPRVAEDAARLAHDEARAGEVPQRPEREDRGVDFAGRDHPRRRHQDLTPWRAASRSSRPLVAQTYDVPRRHMTFAGAGCRPPDLDRLGVVASKAVSEETLASSPTAPDRPPRRERRCGEQADHDRAATSRANRCRPLAARGRVVRTLDAVEDHRLAALPGCGPTLRRPPSRRTLATSPSSTACSGRTRPTRPASVRLGPSSVLVGEMRQRTARRGRRARRSVARSPRRHHISERLTALRSRR